MVYEVGFKPAALRQLRKLDEDVQVMVLTEIELLAENPRPDGCKKLKGETIYPEFELLTLIGLFTKFKTSNFW